MPSDARRLLPTLLSVSEAPLFLGRTWAAVAAAIVASELRLIEIDGERFVRTRDLLAALDRAPEITERREP